MAIALTAGVRQNLLSLQSTADMMSATQNRLATGKKVNSALDNPSNFFTSAKLNDRAADLGSLLDSIGQATKTLDAANNGITSLTKLVQSAKSTAQQARQSTGPTNTYGTLDASASIISAANLNGAETVGTTTGTSNGVNLEAQAVAISGATITETMGSMTATGTTTNAQLASLNSNAGPTAGTVRFSVTERNGTAANFDVSIAATDTSQAAVVAKINGTSATVNGSSVAFSSLFDVSYVSNALTITAKSASTDFTLAAGGSGSTAGTLTDLGLTGGNVGAHNSSSLFDQFSAAGGASGNTITIAGTDAAGTALTGSTITFGTGATASAVNTLADLNTQLGAAATTSGGAFSASVTAGKITITQPAGTKSSITVGGTASTVTAAANVLGTTNTVFGTHNSQPTLKDLGASYSGAGGAQDLSGGGSLSIGVNGTNFTVGLAANDRIDDVLTKLNASSLAANLNFSKVTDGSGHDHIKIDAENSAVDFTVNANGTSAALGLTSNISTATSGSSISLLDRLTTKLGSAGPGQGKTLTVAANGGSDQTITFGTGTGQVQTLDQLNTALTGLSGVTASVTSSGALDIAVASGSSATSLKIGGTAASSLGLTAGTQTGAVMTTSSNATRASLQTDFNNVLDQIDSLAKDASYNGINLLNGDDLKVTFNESGSSSLTIKGVTFGASNLTLNKQNGTQFQSNDTIDTVIAAADTALNSLRTQASKFGSTLTTVQTRQDFTKNMINTLQTGADSLVLADTNEEGANLLALQTRQQLSTTALSMANQASQAVLRLF
ncbi:MAG: hypothetical protein JWN71_3042 [Xanthobacteraceae bacterium]|nr:hypothetical protein [Xanthobacteraceae bacterium]